MRLSLVEVLRFLQEHIAHVAHLGGVIAKRLDRDPELETSGAGRVRHVELPRPAQAGRQRRVRTVRVGRDPREVSAQRVGEDLREPCT